MLFCYFLFFFGFSCIVFFNVHYILVLLLLEVLLLSIFLMLGWNFFLFLGLSGLFVFLLIMVCMGGFSISLLVCLARFFGRDFWFHRFVF